MIGVVVAMHGDLADALVHTAKQVVKDFDGLVAAAGIHHNDKGTDYEGQLAAAVDSVKAPGGVLILTDMFGGTPSNVGMTLHRAGEVEVLTGANLPMVIKALQLACRAESVDLALAARQVKEAGERAITIATEILSSGKGSSAPREILG